MEPTDKMPPTDKTDALIPDTSDTQAAREKFEQARLSRRAALRKMGLTTGMAFFSMFAVDDLARMAIKKIEENKQTREIGETVAREFKNSGIAFADAQGSSQLDTENPAQKEGDTFGTGCASNPGKAQDGTPLTCTGCVRAKCFDKYNYLGIIPEPPEYGDCYSQGTTHCGG